MLTFSIDLPALLGHILDWRIPGPEDSRIWCDGALGPIDIEVGASVTYLTKVVCRDETSGGPIATVPEPPKPGAP